MNHQTIMFISTCNLMLAMIGVAMLPKTERHKCQDADYYTRLCHFEQFQLQLYDDYTLALYLLFVYVISL